MAASSIIETGRKRLPSYSIRRYSHYLQFSSMSLICRGYAYRRRSKILGLHLGALKQSATSNYFSVCRMCAGPDRLAVDSEVDHRMNGGGASRGDVICHERAAGDAASAAAAEGGQ